MLFLPSMLFLFLGFAADRGRMADALLVRTDAHGIGACDADEHFLAADRTLVAGRAAAVTAVGFRRPALHVVGQRDAEDLIADPPGHRGVVYGKGRFDAAQEIAGHPVAAGDPDL